MACLKRSFDTRKADPLACPDNQNGCHGRESAAAAWYAIPNWRHDVLIPRSANMPTRRDFLIGATAAGLPGSIMSGVAGPAPAATVASSREETWDQGRLGR